MSRSVVLIDPDLDSLGALASALRSRGLNVTVADSWESANARIRTAAPDALICAASIALQNMLGLSCDPIASRVEAPCLGKNAMAASNAVNSANMALAGYLHLVPLDQVIAAMDKVGQAMPREICCTALGGLSVTPASRALELKLRDQPEL